MIWVMNLKEQILLICTYIFIISVISVIVCIHDKKRAKKGGSRVSERMLLILSALGGSVAMYLTMKKIRHKTLHKKFMIGIPLIIILQISLIIFFLVNRY